MANRRFIDFPIAASVGNDDIVLIWQDGLNKQTTKATLFAGSPNSLAGLTDVDISALANGQILQYNSTTSKWENVDRTDIDLDQLGDVTIVSPTNGQVLVYNSSTSKWENSSGGFVPYTGAVTTVNLGAQSILAGSFVKAGGTSAQFLKADGSVDSTAYGTGSVTSVALTMPTAFSVAGSPVTTAGTLAVTATGTTSQYIRGDGSLATFPSLTGFVPYTGATADVNLGTHDLTAERGTFANNGSSDTLTVNHTSGSGYGIIVTKGGNGEALYVSKTTGSGNAMTVIGGRTSLVDLALSSVTNTAGDFLTLSGGVVHKRTAAEVRTDIGAGTVTSVAALTLGTSGTDLSSTVANGTTTPVITLNVPTASATNRGALSGADWTTFNSKQQALNGTGFVKASGTTISYDNTSYLPLTGGALTGPLTSSSNATFKTSSGIALKLDSNSLSEDNDLRFAKGGVDFGAIQTSGSTGDFEFYVNIDGTGAGYKKSINIKRDATKIDFIISDFINTTIDSSGLTSLAFIKTGGTSSQFLKADGSVDSTTYVPVGRTITINGTTQDLSANRTYNVGTVTSVTASSPLFSSGGTTPNITIQQASGSQNGFLSSTDWTTFNDKANSVAGGYLPLSGGTMTGPLGGTSISLSGSISLANNNIFPTGAGIYQGSNALQIVSGSTEFTVNNNANTVVNLRILNSGAATFISSVTATNFTVTSSTVPTNGMYLPSANTLGFSTNGNKRFEVDSLSTGIFETTNSKWTISPHGKIIQLLSASVIEGKIDVTSSGNSWFGATSSLDGTGANHYFAGNGNYNSKGRINARNATTSASVNPSVMGAGEMMSTGSLAGYFWENRSGGVTSNSNWYGWYAASGINHLWNGSTNLISINGGNGNLGIGDSNPLQKLIVNGGSLLVNPGTNSATAFRDIMIGGIGGWASGESHGIDTVYNTTASPTTFSRIESHFDGTSGRIRFRNLFNNSAPRTDILMTILGNGNVGIGADTPSEKIHINNSSGTGSFIRFQDTAGGGVYIGGRSEAMELYAGGSEAMRITSGRNVLIGTLTNSGDRLRVVGTTFSDEIMTLLPEAESRSNINWRFGAASIGSLTTNRRLRVKVGGVEYWIAAVEI
jgi:hypothetical protein